MKKDITHILIYVSLAIIFGAWLLCMFWWLYPYKTSIQVQPYKVLTPVIVQGDLLKYEIEYLFCMLVLVFSAILNTIIFGNIAVMASSVSQKSSAVQ